MFIYIMSTQKIRKTIYPRLANFKKDNQNKKEKKLF